MTTSECGELNGHHDVKQAIDHVCVWTSPSCCRRDITLNECSSRPCCKVDATFPTSLSVTASPFAGETVDRVGARERRTKFEVKLEFSV